MREMKDSGLRWAGKIPADWKITKGKYSMSVLDRPVKDDDGVITCFRDGIVTLRSNRREGGFTIATVEAGYQGIEPDDLVVHGMDGFAGAIGISDSRGKGTPALNVLDSTENKKYMMYLLRSMAYSEVFMALSTGIRVRTCDTNWRKLRELSYLIPPANEQQAISEYLDRKNAEINQLIADIQDQIDTLEQYKRSVITEAVTKGLNPDAEMKDSGIFYMSPINANWRLTKIGYICTKLTRPFESEDKALICSNKGKVLIRPDDLTGIMISEDNAMQGICKGDIAIHGMDTWHGAIALSDYDGKITRVVHVCNSTEDKRFIVYYLQHLAYQGVYKLISNGVRGNTSDFRSWDKFRDICIAVPERKQEQQEICDYLDKLCIGIDEIIAAKKEQLTVLDDYKKSLIFEYVTGKKEITEAVTVVGINPHVPLLAMVVDMLKRPRGKVVDQKLLYLCDVHLGLGLSTQYYRYDYGPLDLQLDTYIDTLASNGWYTMDTLDRAKILVKAENHVKALEMYENQLLQNKSDIEKLVQYFGEMRMGEIERFATLFAVWNDFIIDGVCTPSDNQIIDDVLTNWGPKKGRFSRGTWQNTLMKMKRDGIIPKGLGLHTLPKPEGGKSDA